MTDARRRTVRVLLVLIAVATGLLLVWQLMPKPYSNDFSHIGSGRAAMVLVHDPDRVVSGEQMMALDDARDSLEQHWHLLVARTGHPDGAALIDRHGGRPGDLLLFAADGELLRRMAPPTTVDALRALPPPVQ